MRILQVIATADPRYGGPIEGIVRSSGALARFGHTRELATLDHPSAPWLKSSSIPVHALGSTRPETRRRWRWLPWVHYGYTAKLVPWLKANASNYDVVVVSGLWNYSTLAARQALVSLKVPYFVFTHGMLDPWFRKTYPLKTFLKQISWWFNEGPLLANASGVLFTCEEERLLAKDAFWPYQIKEFVVGYGTSYTANDAAAQVAEFRSSIRNLGGKRFLLFLSRIHPKKGCDLLIEAFAKVAHSAPDLDLVMAGPDQIGWIAQLKKQATRYGIEDRIHWPGMLEGSKKWGAFHGCEAFVLPSHQENFGIVVAEALACGKPVLITDKVNIWREIERESAGIVEKDDGAGIVSLLERFMNMNDDERAIMGVKARSAFSTHFDVDQNVTKLLSVFREAGLAQ
ncbi:glycosyltransferase [Bradyrhizobium sp. DN5]|uniref:glycosyltransferase n=1 Tax=Bradyrhizobium sp. DN5 TaxID=3056950 RepID=UPI0035264E3F